MDSLYVTDLMKDFVLVNDSRTTVFGMINLLYTFVSAVENFTVLKSDC